MKKKITNSLKIILIILLVMVVYSFINNQKKEILRIDIGYQSVTAQTWGALIIKNNDIFEKKLENLYPDKKIEIVWHNEISGANINSNMISGKYQIGFMGDMPLILNLNKASELEEYNATLIGIDGRGVDGINQSIVIPKNSKINSIFDLKGKTVSTPVGSSAHYMLMTILEKYKMTSDVSIVHQDVAIAAQLLNENKVDAFSIWEPYPTYLQENNYSKILIDGSETGIDYLNGIIVDQNWANENQMMIELFIESIEEAHDFINNNPLQSAKIFSLESGFSYETTSEIVKKIKWESNIYEEDLINLSAKIEFLIKIDQISEFSINDYIINENIRGGNYG